MADLKANVGELHFKVQVTRKETGKVEEYDLIGKVTHEQAEQLGLIETKEKENGSNS